MDRVKVNKVLFTEIVDRSCHDLLKKHGIVVDVKTGLSPEQLSLEIKDYEALVVRSETKVTKDLIEKGEKLKIIGRAGTGVDNIDVDEATKRGILVLNSPGGNSISACELTCGLILDLARNIAHGCGSLKAGKWERSKMKGEEIAKKSLGVLGLGRVGREVARRMQAFGMTILGFDPVLNDTDIRGLGFVPSTLSDIWQNADYITIHTPLNNSTRNLISRETLEKCKKGVKIINVARGGIVNEDDLLEALNSGKVGGAALDVFSQEPPKSENLKELISHPKIIATPHLGASTAEAQIRVAVEIAEQIVALSHPDSQFKVHGCVNALSLKNTEKKERTISNLIERGVPATEKATFS